MTIRHLEIFLQVYHLESITRAAESLHMTQPAVSVAIRELEKHYGIVLFERLGRRLFVTQEGQSLYARAVHIVEAFREMEQGMGQGGILRVGSSVTLGSFLLPKAAKRWAEIHPESPLKVTVANGAALQQMLCDNLLDVAVIEGPIERPELENRVFRKDRLVLVLPERHPLANWTHITVEDALAYPLLLREKGSVGRAMVDRVLESKGLKAQIAWESIDTQALFQAVKAGLGVAFLPKELAEAERGVVIREMTEGLFIRDNVLVWHRHKRMTPVLRDWMALLETCE